MGARIITDSGKSGMTNYIVLNDGLTPNVVIDVMTPGSKLIMTVVIDVTDNTTYPRWKKTMLSQNTMACVQGENLDISQQPSGIAFYAPNDLYFILIYLCQLQ